MSESNLSCVPAAVPSSSELPAGGPAPSVFCQAARLELELRLEHLELEPGLCAYRLSVGAPDGFEVPRAFALRAGRTVEEGLARTPAIQAFLAGRASHIEKLHTLTLVVPEFRELARLHGFMGALEVLEQSKTQCEVHEPFRAFVEGGAALQDIVRLDHGSHMLFDRNDEVLPVGVYFDYMHGNFHEASYDLPRALEALRANPQVTVLPARRARGNEAPGIQAVPYYNAEPGRSAFIAFRFAPTVEQVRALWAEQRRLHSKYPSTRIHEAMFNLDTLGLRAAGIARFDHYLGHIEVSCPTDGRDD